jgi:hypothetical protein
MAMHSASVELYIKFRLCYLCRSAIDLGNSCKGFGSNDAEHNRNRDLKKATMTTTIATACERSNCLAPSTLYIEWTK